jgi:hypothetical protein
LVCPLVKITKKGWTASLPGPGPFGEVLLEALVRLAERERFLGALLVRHASLHELAYLRADTSIMANSAPITVAGLLAHGCDLSENEVRVRLFRGAAVRLPFLRGVNFGEPDFDRSSLNEHRDSVAVRQANSRGTSGTSGRYPTPGG